MPGRPVTLLALAVYLSCAPGVSAQGRQDTRFRLVERLDPYCVFVEKDSNDSTRYVAMGKQCATVAGARWDIVIDEGVALSTRDLGLALSFLQAHFTRVCEKYKDAPLLACLKDEIPNGISAEGDRLVFWYRRALHPGDVGLPVTLARRGDSFEVYRGE